MLDLIVRNGRVFAGTGATPREPDIGIKDGRLALVRERIDESADQCRDVRGFSVLPGFVDILTHHDLEVEVAPDSVNRFAMG
jgi:N-acyl-D-amino-acid deacylase